MNEHAQYLAQIARRTAQLGTLYRTMGQQHARLGQTFIALADLYDEIEIPPLEQSAPESEPESSTIPTEVRPPEMGVHKPSTVPPALCFDWQRVEFPPIAAGSRVRLDHGQYYTHHGIVTEDVGPYCKIRVDIGVDTELGKRWLTVKAPPTEGNEITAVVAATDPGDGNCAVNDLCTLELDHDGDCLVPPTIEEALARDTTDDRTPKRSKTDMTAAQWATSKHFLAYVTRTRPFSDWTAEEQNAARDRFVAAQPADLTLNRWGQRFAKFCGVS